MTEEEIQIYLEDYRHAAQNAIIAGFDGVELHGANGYLVDQFFQDMTNTRTDKYGGSIENRARFGIEATKALIKGTGDSKKVGARLSPFSDYQGMGMKDAVSQFVHITEELKKLDLAYLHLVESRDPAHGDETMYREATGENTPFIEAWGSTGAIVLAGGFTPEKATRTVNQLYSDREVVIAFGRHFISSPDLPFRIQKGIELSKYDRATFYEHGMEGYADYPFSDLVSEGSYRGSLAA